MELRVADNPDKARYEVYVGAEIVGFIDYKLSQNDIAFLHTETDERFRGKGIASRLVQATLDSAGERGLEVLPYCPFVRGWLGQHPDYVKLIPVGRRAEFGL